MPIHHENIEGLRAEALRVADLEIQVITNMIEQNILYAPSENEQTFDIVSAPKTIDVLQGEQHKLKNLDMVLAIVGTMKAGKSTTINAIVGTEILPNRNAPMTAIPTLIRHTKGQTQPKLVFENHQPLNDLIDQLRPRISMSEYQEKIQNLVSDRDLFSLIEKIRNNQAINHQAIGEDAIFDFLKSVNDLVRISPILGVEFPFSDYGKIYELPVIEVEFKHLKEMEGRQGRLILLDTPGPNEAGQHHLRPMLQDQLCKASAVLVVMDYTQLKSVADEQIRADLTSIAKSVEGRIYALVNKFDQKDSNSMQAEEVRSFVEAQTNKQIVASKVFPVSSKHAYLANRARHDIQLHGKLPEITEQPWVEDFFEAAGVRKKFREDYDEINEAVEELWMESNFSEPLKDVIEVAYDKAALMALGAATVKCVETANNINNFLQATASGLGKSTDELQRLVKTIQVDIDNVYRCEKDAQGIIESNLKKLDADIKKTTELLKEKNKTQFEYFFKNGTHITKEIEESDEKQRQKQLALSSKIGEGLRNILLPESIKTQILQEFTKNQLGLENKYTPEEVIPDSNGIVYFYQDKQKAEDFTQNIQVWVQGEIDKAKSSVERILEQMISEFSQSYQKDVIESATKTLDCLKSTLSNAGLKGLRLELPHTSTLDLNINIAGLASDAVHQETKTQTRYRDASGITAKAKRFFGGLFDKDWGKDSYQVKVNEYQVNLQLMQQKVFESVDVFFDQMNGNIQQNIKHPIERSSERFFKSFKDTVEHVRGDLLKTLATKQQDQRVQDELLQKISQIKKNMPDLLTSADDLKKNLEQFSRFDVK